MIIFAVYSINDFRNEMYIDDVDDFLLALINFCKYKAIDINIEDSIEDKQESIDYILNVIGSYDLHISNYIKFSTVVFNTICIENNNLEVIIKKKDN